MPSKNALYRKKLKDIPGYEEAWKTNMLLRQPAAEAAPKVTPDITGTPQAAPVTAPVTTPAVTPAVPVAKPATPTNLLTASSSAPGAPDKFQQYWSQPVMGNMPLDQFVRLAGMASHAIDPTGPGGRLGKDLSAMGGEAYKERSRREYEGPNRLLQQQIAKATLADEIGRAHV